MKTTYLIDGVSVPKRIYERRKIWGEHPEAKFQVIQEREKERKA